MKLKKSETGMKELFRRKLENAEVIPSPSVEAQLMKKLARKEFVRFNPARFNIYYLGLIAAVAVTAGLLLTGKPGNDERITNPEPGIENKSTVNTITIPQGRVIKEKDPELAISTTVNGKVKMAAVKENVRTENNNDTKETAFTSPAISNAEITKSNILSNTAPLNETGRLKEKSAVLPLFEPSVYGGCKPLKIHFRSNIDLPASFSWNFGDGGFSAAKDPDWIFDVEGEYRVVLNVVTANGKSLTHSVLINVYPRPVARFEFSPDKPVIPDDEIRFINYSTNALSYKWNFGDGTGSSLFEPKHTYQKFGKYNIQLTVASENGCTDSLIIANAFSGSEYFIDMPNAFIPNPQGPSGGLYTSKSDESAEIFHPNFSGVAEFQLRIFSRNGILLFESNDINIGWDGYYNGQLNNTGVYIWKIRGKFSNGEPFTKMGNVTLLKN
jgi:PKD repeat protein